MSDEQSIQPWKVASTLEIDTSSGARLRLENPVLRNAEPIKGVGIVPFRLVSLVIDQEERRVVVRGRQIEGLAEKGAIGENLDDDPSIVRMEGGYGVYEWSPGRVDEGVPCEQVHLQMHLQMDGVKFHPTIRLKSRRACDELILALIEHRDNVFPVRT